MVDRHVRRAVDEDTVGRKATVAIFMEVPGGGTCLGSGRLDLTGTGERAVNLTHVG